MTTEELNRIRDWLDGQCKARHESATRNLRLEIAGVREETRQNTANVAEMTKVLAQGFGDGTRKGEIGRMQTDIEELQQGRREDQVRMTRQEQLHYKILVTCFLGASVGVGLLKALELLLGNAG